MKTKLLLDDDGEGGLDDVELKINKDYARRFEVRLLRYVSPPARRRLAAAAPRVAPLLLLLPPLTTASLLVPAAQQAA